METTTETLDTVLSLSELAAGLGVTVRTIYDLRSQGRGPRGFRVNRELRFWGSSYPLLRDSQDPAPQHVPFADDSMSAM